MTQCYATFLLLSNYTIIILPNHEILKSTRSHIKAIADETGCALVELPVTRISIFTYSALHIGPHLHDFQNKTPIFGAMKLVVSFTTLVTFFSF